MGGEGFLGGEIIISKGCGVGRCEGWLKMRSEFIWWSGEGRGLI